MEKVLRSYLDSMKRGNRSQNDLNPPPKIKRNTNLAIKRAKTKLMHSQSDLFQTGTSLKPEDFLQRKITSDKATLQVEDVLGISAGSGLRRLETKNMIKQEVNKTRNK